MKEQKLSTYKKHGIDLNDPQAAAKMHFPIGKVPEGVVTSTTGPSPEKALRERLQEKQNAQAGLALSQGSRSISSGISSAASTKEPNLIAPWDT